MERLTNEALIKALRGAGKRPNGMRAQAADAIEALSARLAAYEDTGLEPGEVSELKATVEEIKVSVDELWEKQTFLKFLEGKGIDPYAGINWMREVFDVLHDADNHEVMTTDRLREIVEADQAGRLVVLPCKVGDTVYTNQSWSGDSKRNKDKPYCHKVVFIGLNGVKDFFNTVNVKTERLFSFDFSNLGKTVFLTREEAEAALEGGTL